MAPYVALTALFFLAPMLTVFVRSLNGAGALSLDGLTLDNYTAVFESDVLRRITVKTVMIGVYTTAVCLVLGFPTAYLISRLSSAKAGVLLALILLPFAVSILIRLFALTTVLGREGLINAAADSLGAGPFDLLFNTPATVVGMANYLLPYMVLVLFAGMSRIDNSLLFAARSLGASPRQAFMRVYLPQIKSVVLSACTLVFVLSIGFFLTPAVLGGGGDTTVALYIQQQIEVFRWGVASAIGVLLLLISLVGYFITIRLVGPTQLVGAATGGSKSPVGTEPLRWSPTTVALWVAAAASIALLVIPLGVVIATSFGGSFVVEFPPRDLTLEWYGALFEDPIWTSAMGKSALVALGTAIVSTGVGLAAARVITSVRSATLRSFAQAALLAPLIVPLILLAVGMFDVQGQLGMLGTTWGLVLLHAVIAIPFAFAVLSAALAGVDPELESAARTLGASRTRAFWAVTVRSIVPALAGALVLTFMVSWDEVVIALFQTGFDATLPVLIFSFIKSGVEPTVPAIATLLIVLVVAGFALLGLRRLLSRRSRRSRPRPELREVP
jgi:putative spermidine/putrescine transport system permease protein